MMPILSWIKTRSNRNPAPRMPWQCPGRELELRKDGGYYEVHLNETASRPSRFQFRPLPWELTDRAGDSGHCELSVGAAARRTVARRQSRCLLARRLATRSTSGGWVAK